MFIISIIISFTVLLLAYDTVSGEKEARTLALSLSNSVSRGLVLFGKYLSVILSTILVLVPGIALSLVIILSSGKILITRGTLVEIVFFLAVSILFVACITAFGILASVLTHRANVSLVAALSFWLLFVVVVPNTAIYWAQTLFPIEKMENVMRRIDMEREDVEKQMPEGWSENRSSYVENRAKLENDLLAAEMKVRRDWYNQMFSQYERTRMITALSPVSIFEYLCEAVVGGGYLRFRKNWRDMKSFQLGFLQFVKETDAKDPESEHNLNPGTWSGSWEPVDFADVPLFKEKAPSFHERFSHAGIYLLLMVIYTAGAFALSFVLFLRYDVR
jgi:ABC-type transport system involved in multi-copper enzyme maturation permease subunit